MPIAPIPSNHCKMETDNVLSLTFFNARIIIKQLQNSNERPRTGCKELDAEEI